MALWRVLVLLCSCALMLSACGGEDEAEPTSTSAVPVDPTVPAVQATTPAAPEPGPADTPEQQQQGAQTYRVRSGDTLSAIAERFNTTVRALVRENDLADPNMIRPGRRLRIP